MRQADLTRQRLVRAALELFTTQGYHDTTTPQLAKRAGIAEGTIYRHFTSKQHLLNELYRAAARWATQHVREAEATGGSLRDRLGKLGESLVDGTGREPAVVRLFFFHDLAALLDDKSREAAREFRGALETMLAQGKAAGEVRPGGVDVLGAAWVAVIRVALERILAKEWAANSAGVGVCIGAAWAAIAQDKEQRAESKEQ